MADIKKRSSVERLTIALTLIQSVMEDIAAQPNLQPTCNQLATDCISRRAAIDAASYECGELRGVFGRIEERLKALPSAQSELRFDEWCTDCKEYDKEKHCCPRWNRVIRTTLQDAQRTGRWIKDRLYSTSGGTYGVYRCSECVHTYQDIGYGFNYCPNCGARMEVEE